MGLLPGSLPPYDLVYSYFEDFICTGTNSGERRAHDDIWRDTDALRRFLIGIENPNAADHGSNVARQRKRRHIAIRALCCAADHDRARRRSECHCREFRLAD